MKCITRGKREGEMGSHCLNGTVSVGDDEGG